MMRVWNCVVEQHDAGLVLVSALLAALAAVSGSTIVRRARASAGRTRLNWLVAAAIVTGVGVWATHFVGMLAFRPPLPMDFNHFGTAASMLTGVAGAGVAYAIWLYAPVTQTNRALGAATLGISIAGLHYVGMASIEIAAQKNWSADLVIASVLLAIAFPMLGAWLARTHPDGKRPSRAVLLASTACFTAGIAALHYTGMGAVSFTPDPRVPGPAADVDLGWLAFPIILSAIVITAAGIAAAMADTQIARIRLGAARRMQRMADASFEGLALHDGETISEANIRLHELLGAAPGSLQGRNLCDLIPEWREAGEAADGAPWEARTHGAFRAFDAEVQTRLLSAEDNLYLTAIRDISQRKENEARIAFLREHDALTGLPNAILFSERLELAIHAAAQGKTRFALLHIDVRELGHLNLTAGHSAGDKLLCALAARLIAEANGLISACRLAGDEFAFLLSHVQTAEEASAEAEALRRLLCRPLEIGAQTYAPSVTIGVAFYPDDGAAPRELMDAAAFAQARASAEGSETVGFHDAMLNAERRARRTMERDLRAAIENGEIEPFYQPQALAATGLVQGFEALARWRRADGQMVMPSDFIPIAEETGLIEPLGELVLRKAVRDAVQWPDYFRLGVNLSARQIARVDVPRMVERALAEAGLPPGRLELELTESMIIGDFGRARAMMQNVKDIGVKLALDDFGVGYSSLAYLNDMPVDRIKIDRAFVSNAHLEPGKLRILRAILDLSRALGMETLAEGVECQEELDVLVRERCDFVQGYFIARPMPLRDLPGFLEAHLVAMAARLSASEPQERRTA